MELIQRERTVFRTTRFSHGFILIVNVTDLSFGPFFKTQLPSALLDGDEVLCDGDGDPTQGSFDGKVRRCSNSQSKHALYFTSQDTEHKTSIR